MKSFKEMWNIQSSSVKVGILVGALLIVALTAAIGVWAYRSDYQVLFADLSSGDAASMTAELDRMKIPYQLSDGGNTILVPKETVYKTRLKLMSKEIPLHGAVGFEVFNNADFGMTEFVQKVNYQRAIQGELTRTILSIEDIQSARVHIALPEQGLFKKAGSKPKASVTVAMKSGRTLEKEQISGIQRLIAASVPDILPQDVTVLDQRGVALTRVASSGAGVDFSDVPLDSKRSTEDYLAHKVNQVLDQTLGQGAAIATVDVLLNMEQSQITTEEVLPAKGVAQEGSPTGVIVHERQTLHDGGSAFGLENSSAVKNGSNSSAGTTSIESDYQVGRRVAQSVTVPGSVRRMTVAVVVKKTLSDSELSKLKEVVALAVGIDAQRGDGIVVYSLNTLGADAAMPVVRGDPLPPQDAAQLESTENAQTQTKLSAVTGSRKIFPGVILLLSGLLGLVLVSGAIYMASRARPFSGRKRLTQEEREKMLLAVRQWIEGAAAPSADEVAGARK